MESLFRERRVRGCGLLWAAFVLLAGPRLLVPLAADPGLARGVNVDDGRIVLAEVAEAFADHRAGPVPA